MQWRFLPNSSDEEPGFCTAWMRQQSLKRQADCREQEYRNKTLARFANEFGITTLPSHASQGVDDCSEGDDNAEEERDDIVHDIENNSVSSRPPVDGLPVHRDRPISTEVGSVKLTCTCSKPGSFDMASHRANRRPTVMLFA